MSHAEGAREYGAESMESLHGASWHSLRCDGQGFSDGIRGARRHYLRRQPCRGWGGADQRHRPHAR